MTQNGSGCMERYRSDCRRPAGRARKVPQNPVSISCLAAIISAATVSYHMYVAVKEAADQARSLAGIKNLVEDGVVGYAVRSNVNPTEKDWMSF